MSTSVPTEIHQRLWDQRDLRGAHTSLPCNEATALQAMQPDVHSFGVHTTTSSRRIERSLAERFDFIEVCCGGEAPLLNAAQAAHLRTGPRIDIKFHPMWDLREYRILEWLLWLIQVRRVRHVHLATPCTTFSVARKPALRSKAAPWGFDPTDPATALGNFFLRFTLIVLWAIARTQEVSGSHEHPLGAYSWHAAQWKCITATAGYRFVKFAMCAFGAPYRKLTGLATVNAPFLQVLGRLCPGLGHPRELQVGQKSKVFTPACEYLAPGPHLGHPRELQAGQKSKVFTPACEYEAHRHIPLEGSLTTRAAQYPLAFAQAFVGALAGFIRLAGPLTPLDDPTDLQWETGDGATIEKLCFNWFARHAPWREVLRARVKVPQHINILEQQALVKLQCLEARAAPSSRQLALIDSQVNVGVAAKGRSAATSLNLPLRSALPDFIAFDYYPGVGFFPTRLNPADAPSRFRDAPQGEPTDHVDCPGSMPALPASLAVIDWLGTAPTQSRRAADWACFVLLLHAACRVPPFVLKGFDSTLGYPGEGPRATRGPRVPTDLIATRAHVPAVLNRRATYVDRFARWLAACRDVVLTEVLLEDALVTARLLADYGQFCYDNQRSRSEFSETINAITDRAPHLKGHLAPAWDVSWTWRALEPGGSHRPIPEAIARAFVALACAWGWHDVALAVLIGFLGMMRPGELIKLRVANLVLPRKGLSTTWALYVHIALPKMRRLSARREHVRIDDPLTIAYCEALVNAFVPDDFVFCQGRPALFRRAWNALCAHLCIPALDMRGLTPASLRAGGATFWFRLKDSADWVRYRGRWANQRMLEIYIQEVAADDLLQQMSPSNLELARLLSAGAQCLICNFLASNGSD